MTSGRLLLLILLTLIFIVPLTACQQGVETPVDYRKEGNPALSSPLNGLVLAEKSGDAASFARQNSIELVDSRVRVIIEAQPGQVNAAAAAATRLGKVESSYNDLLQVLIPIDALTSLADEPSVRFIRLPLPVATDAPDSKVK